MNNADRPEDLCGELHRGDIDQLQLESGLYLVTSVTTKPTLFSTCQSLGLASLRTIKARGAPDINDNTGTEKTDQVGSELKHFIFLILIFSV